MGFFSKLFRRSSEAKAEAEAVTPEGGPKYWPRVGKRRVLSKHKLGDYFAVLYGDLESLGHVQYAYVLFVIDENDIVLCVASEREDEEVFRDNAALGQPSYVLGVFPGTGHQNMGRSDDWGDVDKFRERALEVARERLGVSEEATTVPERPLRDVPLEQTSYDMAYFILPPLVNERVAKLRELLERPAQLGPFLYFVACQSRGAKPEVERADAFKAHLGSLDAIEYLVLEYPAPHPVDLDGVEPQDLLAGKGPVLAPLFSAVLFTPGDDENLYFVLGQAPTGGGTTLRRVTANSNANLGPGPAPELEAFLETLRERLSQELS